MRGSMRVWRAVSGGARTGHCGGSGGGVRVCVRKVWSKMFVCVYVCVGQGVQVR